VIGQAEQGRDRPEGETGRHHQRRVHALTRVALTVLLFQGRFRLHARSNEVIA
jgi:hypothetical protein